MIDEAACYKTEADTLRRIVMEALAEQKEEHPFRIWNDPNHWTNRARKVLGVE